MPKGKHKSFRNRFCEIETRLNDDTNQPLIDINRLNRFLKGDAGIVRWCYIIHDKDTYTESDAELMAERLEARREQLVSSLGDAALADKQLAEERRYLPIGKVGELKPKHIHVVIQFVNDRSYDAIAKEVGVNPQCVNKPTAKLKGILKGKQFEAMATYLTHKDETQQELGKHVYSDAAVTTSGFDYTALTAKYLDLRRKQAISKMPADKVDAITNAIAAGEVTLTDIVDDYGFAFYQTNKKAFSEARQHFLMSDDFSIGMRINIYICPDEDYARTHPDDTGGIGKTALARILGKAFNPELPSTKAYHEASDIKVAFDKYVEQDTLIISESRAGIMKAGFGREGVFSMLDVFPGKESHNIKYGDVVLVNHYTILNGIDPMYKFLDGLAGEYDDKNGRHNSAEARSQVYRRFPLVITLTDSGFTLLGNDGFFTGDKSRYLNYSELASGPLGVSELMGSYTGEALDYAFSGVVNAVKDEIGRLRAMQDSRKCRVEDVLAEHRPYVVTYDPYGSRASIDTNTTKTRLFGLFEDDLILVDDKHHLKFVIRNGQEWTLDTLEIKPTMIGRAKR